MYLKSCISDSFVLITAFSLAAHLAAATATAAADAAANEKNKTEDEYNDRKYATKGAAERVPCVFYNLSSRHSLYVSRSMTFDGSD